MAISDKVFAGSSYIMAISDKVFVSSSYIMENSDKVFVSSSYIMTNSDKVLKLDHRISGQLATRYLKENYIIPK